MPNRKNPLALCFFMYYKYTGALFVSLLSNIFLQAAAVKLKAQVLPLPLIYIEATTSEGLKRC